MCDVSAWKVMSGGLLHMKLYKWEACEFLHGMAFCVECKKYKKAFKSTQYTEPIHIVVSSIQLSLGTCITCLMVQQEARFIESMPP